ncbi:hypothetical protein Actkin_02251 [Actinokineospora sp. UTMC 2448]|nr:hypothetical protein Actkin_02251 [Actinokineospora sp. UTMC 2448]
MQSALTAMGITPPTGETVVGVSCTAGSASQEPVEVRLNEIDASVYSCEKVEEKGSKIVFFSGCKS